MLLDVIEDTSITVAMLMLSLHFGVPLAYYQYLKNWWLGRDWGLQTDEGYRPKVTILVPTYNEADWIERKLDNLREQQYPHELTEIFVVDSSSTDKTTEVVERWMIRHPDTNVRLLKEFVRGKMAAILEATRSASGSIIVVGDADSTWETDAIRHTVKYFADPSVGAVTGSLRYSSEGQVEFENAYREFYNLVRVAESKIHSTPVHSGVLQAVRRQFFERNLLPTFRGSEDCAIASYIAFVGYRAIQADDVWTQEPLRGSRIKTKVRRAQHNLCNFLFTKTYAKRQRRYTKSKFDAIWYMEKYLHTVNPWLVVIGLCLLLYSWIILWDGLAAIILAIGVLLVLLIRDLMMWLSQQLYLTLGMIRTLWDRNIVWNR